MSSRFLRFIAIASIVLFSSTASAQTWVNPNTGLINDPLNWVGGVPLDSVDSIWTFPGAAGEAYGIINNFIGGYQLNGINWTSVSTGATIFAPSTSVATSLAFSQSTAAVNPFMNMSSAGPVLFSTPLSIAGAATGITFGGNGPGILYFNGTMSGVAKTITKTGNHRLILQQNNDTTLTGATVWNINGGIVDIQTSISRLGSITASTVAVNFNGGTLAATTSGGSASASRSFALQSGANGIDVQIIGTTFSIATSPFTGAAAASLTKSGPGILSFGSTYAGMLSDITVSGGTLLAAADGAFGTGNAIVVNSGATVGFTAAAALPFTLANNRSISAAGTGFVDITALNNNGVGSGAVIANGTALITYPNPISLNGTTAISGVNTIGLTLSGAVGEGTVGSNLVKDGTVPLNLTAAAAYTGTTTIRTGTLSLAGATGSLPNGSTSGIIIGGFANTVTNVAGRLQLDNTAGNTDRVSDFIPITMRGGAINLIANTTTSSTEFLGNITLDSGTASFTTVPNAAAGAVLQIGSLTRNNRATAIFRGTSLGNAPGANVSDIIVNSGFVSTDFSGVANSAGSDREVLRWGAGTTTTGLAPNNFLTRDVNTGLRFLSAAEINTTATIAAANNFQNIKNNTGNVTGDAVINALDINGLTLNMAANTFLRVNSGLILNNTTTVSINSQFNAAVLDFGNNEPIYAGRAILHSAYIVSNNGFTRAAGDETGNTTLTLNQPNVISGRITLNGIGNIAGGGNGNVLVNNLSSLGNPNNAWDFAGGRLIIQAAPTAILPSNITVREGGGELNFGAGSADPSPMFTHTGTLSGTGRFTKSGAATLVITQNNSGTFSGQTNIANGILSISSANNLGTGELLLTAGRLLVTGNSTFGPTRSVGLAGAFALSVNSGATTVFQGVVTGSGALTKNGPGDLVFEGLNTTNTALTISGTPSLRQPVGTGGSAIFRGANGQSRSSAAIVVASGTSLVFDNSGFNNNNRIRDDGPITVAGGTFRAIGNAASPTTELTGVFTLGAVAAASDSVVSRVNLEPGAGQQLIVAPTSIARISNRAQLLLTGPIPSGTNPATWLGPNVANFIPLAFPVLAGTSSGVGTQKQIFAGAMGDQTLGGNGTGFLTYEPVAGFRLLGASEYAPTFADANATNINVSTAATVSGINSATTINSLILNGGHDVQGTGTLTLTSATMASLGGAANTVSVTNLAVAAANTLNIFGNTDLMISSNIITGTTGVHKSGAGKLTLTGTNTFTGGLAASGGTISVASDTNLGGTSSALSLDGATLQVTSPITINGRTLTVLARGGTIDIGVNNVSFGLTGGVGIGSTTLTALVGPVTKIGTGALTVGSLNTTSFAGGMNLQQGSIVFSTSLANISDGAPINISSGATLSFNGASSDTVGSITGSGTMNVGGAVAFALTAGSATSITPDVTFSGNITGTATSSIIKAGQGDWTINPGATLSNFPGTWSVVGGRLILGGDALLNTDGVLGNGSSAIAVGTTASDSSSLLTSGAFTVARPITVNTGATTAMAQPVVLGTLATSGTSTFSGNITIGTAAGGVAKLMQFTAAAGGTADFTGLIAIGGGYTGVATIEKVGAGTVQMSNAGSTYAGRTVLTSGTLAFGADGTAAAGPIGVSTLVINGGTITAAGGNRTIDNAVIVNNNVTFGGVNNLTFNGTNPFFLGLGTRTLTVNAPMVTINGEVRGSQGFSGFGSLIKEGPGILNLTNNNTYSGNSTTVNGGTFRVNNPSTGSGTGMGPVVVNIGGTIGGNGYIVPTTGNVDIFGTVAPGNSVGTLTFGSLLSPTSVSAPGHYTFELSTAGISSPPDTGGSTPTAVHDKIVVFGTLSVVGMTIDPVSLGATGFDPTMSYSWTVATATGGITGLPTVGPATGLEFSGYTFFTGVVGTSLYLNFSPVPEPGTVLAICAAGAGAVGLIRRRLKKGQLAV